MREKTSDHARVGAPTIPCRPAKDLQDRSPHSPAALPAFARFLTVTRV